MGRIKHDIWLCNKCEYPQPYVIGGCDYCGNKSLIYIGEDYLSDYEDNWYNRRRSTYNHDDEDDNNGWPWNRSKDEDNDDDDNGWPWNRTNDDDNDLNNYYP